MKLTNSYTLGKKATTALLIALFALLLIPISVMASNTAKATELNGDRDSNGEWKTIRIEDCNQDGQISSYGFFKVNNIDLEWGYKECEFGDDESVNYVTTSNGITLNIMYQNGSSSDPTTDVLSPMWKAGYYFDKWEVYKNGSKVGDAELNKQYSSDDFTEFVAKYKKCGVVSGTVVDSSSKTNEAIPYAVVEFYNGQGFYAQTSTDLEGKFNISADDVNGGIIEITQENYQIYRTEITLAKEEKKDLGEIVLVNIDPNNSVTIKGKVIAKDESEEFIDNGVGNAYIYFAGTNNELFFTISKYWSQASKINDEETGSFSLTVNKNCTGKLYIIKEGYTYCYEEGYSIEVHDDDINLDQDFTTLTMNKNTHIINFKSSDKGSIVYSDDYVTNAEASFVNSSFTCDHDEPTNHIPIYGSWNDGAISIPGVHGHTRTYTPVADEGYAYYDWAIHGILGGTQIARPFRIQDVIDDNYEYVALFKPAGSCSCASADPHHVAFKCTHTTDDFPDEAFSHVSEEFDDTLYAGTVIKYEDGKLVMSYQTEEPDLQTNKTYSQQNVVEAIGEDGYVVNNYYVDGVAITEDSEPVIVAQNSAYTINVDYKLENPVDPVNPDVPGEGENADSSAATGDFAPFAVLAVIAVAAGAGAFALSRKRRSN